MPLKTLILPASVIALLAIVVYIPTFHAGFIWDDDWLVSNNPLMKDLAGLGKIWTFQGTEAPDYYPITWSTLWVESHLWGDKLSGYHVTNVLMHAAGSVLVWLVLRKLGIPAAFWAALIFAVHPINVASIAWVSERKNVLSIIFYLLSILFFLKFDQREGRRWYGLSLAMFVLALLSKTSIIMLPVVLLLCQIWTHRKLAKRDWLLTAPFFVLAVAFACLSVYSQNFIVIRDTVIRQPNENFFFRLAVAGMAPWFYLYKIFLPVKLAMIYPRWAVNPQSLVFFLPGLALAGAMAVLWRFRNGRARPMLLALAYFLATLFPVLGFFTMYFFVYSFVADHWLYVPVISIIALVTAAGWKYTRSVPPFVPASAAVLVVAVLAVLTWQQAGVYQNQETLWRANLKYYPDSWMSHFNLGKALDDKILSEQAIASYRECIRINPNYDKPYLNIGTILAKQSRFGEALGFFGQAIRFNPRSSMAYSNYGAMLHALGRSREGVIYALKALEIQPNYFDPLANLVTIYSTLGQFDPAIQHAQRALEISPGNTQIRLQLAELLVRCNRIDQAVEQYRELNRQDPNMMSPLENLAVLLATAQQDSLRNGAEAFQYAQKVCQLTNWSRPESLDTLGAALAELRRFNEAIAVAAKAEQLAKSAGNTGFAEVVAKHIESYKVSAPLRLQILPAPTAQPPAPTSAPASPK